MAKLNHIGIYVSELENSLKFYNEFFGFEEVHSFTSGEAKISMIDIGGGILELVQRPGSPASPPDGNWSHIAIHDPNFDETVTNLEDKGITKRLVTIGDGNRLYFFSDPEGHVIEIMKKEFRI
jgi:lactoylglutathione lyase